MRPRLNAPPTMASICNDGANYSANLRHCVGSIPTVDMTVSVLGPASFPALASPTSVLLFAISSLLSYINGLEGRDATDRLRCPLCSLHAVDTLAVVVCTLGALFSGGVPTVTPHRFPLPPPLAQLFYASCGRRQRVAPVALAPHQCYISLAKPPIRGVISWLSNNIPNRVDVLPCQTSSKPRSDFSRGSSGHSRRISCKNQFLRSILHACSWPWL